MLRLWAIILFCVLTYIHATATLSKEVARKAVRALNLVDSHGLLTLVPSAVGTLSVEAFEFCARAKKSAIQAQQAVA